MSWKAPKIVELPVGMEINMYACATRTLDQLKYTG
jgi:coenzyme PQQ precursor peptide PqqA